MGLLAAITPDLTALRRSRDYRVIEIGAIVAGLGTQAALVAVPYQVYVLTRSTALVGLVGAAELGPMIVVSLFGGAIADRVDRRRLLLLAQAGTAACAGTLAALAFAGHPPLWAIFVLAALLAGSGSLDSLSRSAMIAGLSGEWLRSAIAFNFGMGSVTAIVGPGLGGILIGAAGVRWVYAADAASVAVTVFAALTIAPQRPHAQARTESILASVGGGLRYVGSNRALLGSFVIDLFAMTFGMPRALFVVLSLTVFHAGAAGTGLLYASVSVGAAVAALANGWLARARRLGRITIVSVLIWGVAIALTGAGLEHRDRRGPARGRRSRRLDQRRVPHDDRAARHPRDDARADDVGVRARGERRRASRGHRIRHRRGGHLAALLGRQRRHRVHRGRRHRGGRLPGARQVRRVRPQRRAGARPGVAARAAEPSPPILRRGVDTGPLRHGHRRVGRTRLRTRGAPRRRGRGRHDRLARSGAERTRRRRACAAAVPDGAAVDGLDNGQAAAAHDLVVLSVPFRSHHETLVHLAQTMRDGQLLVDATVPLAAAVGGRATRMLGVWQGSAAQQSQELVPDGVRVVGALHTVSAAALENLEHLLDEDVLLVGDRRADKQRVASVIDRVPGLRCVDAGRLEMARITESLTALLISVNIRHRTHAGIRITGLPDALW